MSAGGDLSSFRKQAQTWLKQSLPRLRPGEDPRRGMFSDEIDRFAGPRALQGTLFDGGFAGLSFPTHAGGQGLSTAYQQVFNEEARPYEMPVRFFMPTLGIIGATILDFGTPEQITRYIPPMLRGEALWVQFLSEPTCGSDLAGARTSATRDGDIWLINGAKIWSSAAYGCDYAVCLARTNWHVPKHRGLTMFVLDLTAPGIDLRRIRQADGSQEFCQEFFTDVAVSNKDVLGDPDGGWAVASRLLMHERDCLGGGSPYIGDVTAWTRGGAEPGYPPNPDERAADLVVPDLMARTVGQQLVNRAAISPEPIGPILRLYQAERSVLHANLALESGGIDAVIRDEDDNTGDAARLYLIRQASCLAGGSSEMQRNLISERLLKMPRENTPDHGVPFSDVPSGPHGRDQR